MLSLTIMALGTFGVVFAWALVRAGKASVFIAMAIVLGGAGLASLTTGRVALSPRVGITTALVAGALAGAAFYLATIGFVLVVRRWSVFQRHVAEVYDQRRGFSLGAALLLSGLVVAPFEEVFWRGLFQTRLAQALGWPAGAALAWAAYVLANAASGSLPVIAGAIVGGAVWGGLALWTHGALASIVCHSIWTALMIVRPPNDRSLPPAARSGMSQAPASAS
ncbi:MAG: CPBP family intramembrane metalloprotease [Actinobacteria bacterium]|nr:CPBP family intramembrane metalloprotease [Actinomycetota bacterium]